MGGLGSSVVGAVENRIIELKLFDCFLSSFYFSFAFPFLFSFLFFLLIISIC